MTTAYEHETQLVGDDYQGLPTQTVKYRSKPKGSSIDWDQITENYIARGGQVDASVWPNHGKVIVSGSNSARSSRANIHTFTEVEDGEYKEPRQPAARPKRAKTPGSGRRTSLTKAQQEQLGRRYKFGESFMELAKAYSVSETTVANILKALEIPTRRQTVIAKHRRSGAGS